MLWEDPESIEFEFEWEQQTNNTTCHQHKHTLTHTTMPMRWGAMAPDEPASIDRRWAFSVLCCVCERLSSLHSHCCCSRGETKT